MSTEQSSAGADDAVGSEPFDQTDGVVDGLEGSPAARPTARSAAARSAGTTTARSPTPTTSPARAR
jgi:hypothetical protein